MTANFKSSLNASVFAPDAVEVGMSTSLSKLALSEARHSRCVWRRGRRGRALGYDAGGSAVRINENPTSKASGDKEAPGGKTKGKADSACEKKSGDQKEAPELGSGGTAGRRRRAVKFVVG